MTRYLRLVIFSHKNKLTSTKKVAKEWCRSIEFKTEYKNQLGIANKT